MNQLITFVCIIINIEITELFSMTKYQFQYVKCQTILQEAIQIVRINKISTTGYILHLHAFFAFRTSLVFHTQKTFVDKTIGQNNILLNHPLKSGHSFKNYLKFSLYTIDYVYI